MKLEYIVYENSSEEFAIQHYQIKVKVTVGLQKFYIFTTIQTIRYKLGSLYKACMFI